MRIAHCLHMIEGEHTHLLGTEYRPLVSISTSHFIMRQCQRQRKSFS